MAEERDFELLDDYLTNRLNAEDKAYVENRLKQDPELQREYNIQQNIAEALRSARKAELKAMLNAVPVSTGAGSSLLSKLVGTGTVALIIGVGVYLYNDKKNDATQQTSAPQVTTPEETSVTNNEPVASDVTKESKSNAEVNTTPAPGETVVKPAPVTKPATQETSRKPEVYDPTAEAEEGGEHGTEQESNTGDVEMPASEIEHKVVLNDKYKFHYQFNGNLVTLYGPFDKNLYTILDFNDVTTGKRSVFLHYKNSFYQLNEENAVKPLSPVNDPVLLKKLRESR